jgi:hypothetical protein
MSYKTLDGFELNEGDDCFISLSCHTGKHKLSSNPRPAKYMDENAIERGWDFSCKQASKSSCISGDCSCEVTGVWKNKPF